MKPNLCQGALAVLLVLLASCDSDGGDGSGNPTAPLPMLVFAPERAAGSPSIAMRAGPGTTDTLLELEIVANGLVNVQTVDFTLAFPGRLLTFTSAAQGPFLGGASLIVEQAGAGSLTMLTTRLDPSGATGSGVILTIRFQAAAAGRGGLDFVDPEAADPFGLEIAGVDWIGGEVRIVF